MNRRRVGVAVEVEEPMYIFFCSCIKTAVSILVIEAPTGEKRKKKERLCREQKVFEKLETFSPLLFFFSLGRFPVSLLGSLCRF